MSNTHTIPQLKNLLQNVTATIANTYKATESKDPLIELLITFAKNAILPVIPHDLLFPSCTPPTQTPSLTDGKLKDIQTTLEVLTRTVSGLQKKPPPLLTLPSCQP